MEQQKLEFITSHQDSFSWYRNELIDCMLSSGLWKDKTQAGKDLTEELGKWETYIIATQWDQVLWFVSWWPRRIQDRRWEFELFHIGTNANIRSKWVGTQLFQALLDFAKGRFINEQTHLRKFFLYTNIQKTWAHLFYEKIWMSCVWYSSYMFKNPSKELEYTLLFDEEWNKITFEDPFLELAIEISKRLLTQNP